MFILYQLHLVDVAVSVDIHHRQRRPDGEIPANRRSQVKVVPTARSALPAKSGIVAISETRDLAEWARWRVGGCEPCQELFSREHGSHPATHACRGTQLGRAITVITVIIVIHHHVPILRVYGVRSTVYFIFLLWRLSVSNDGNSVVAWLRLQSATPAGGSCG